MFSKKPALGLACVLSLTVIDCIIVPKSLESETLFVYK